MVTEVFKDAAFNQETDEVFAVLLTLTSDELTEAIRVSSDPTQLIPELGNDIYGTVSNGNNFIFLPFEIWLPRDDKTGSVSAKLSIENVDRRIVAQARSVTKPISVKIECVLVSDPDTIEISFDNFQLSNVSYDTMTVDGDLTLNYWGLEPWPSNRFTPSNFPGMF